MPTHKTVSSSKRLFLRNIALTGSFLTLLVASFSVSGGWSLVRAAVGEHDSAGMRGNAAAQVNSMTTKKND